MEIPDKRVRWVRFLIWIEGWDGINKDSELILTDTNSGWFCYQKRLVGCQIPATVNNYFNILSPARFWADSPL
jgi:hypothetical protein